jgi:ferrous iron transport protein B
MKASLRHTWAKGEQYLRKMGGIILFASIIVWALNYFPMHDKTETANVKTAQVDDARVNPDTDSYLEMAGKIINPVMSPLGFHWRTSVAALAGVPAKEIVVSTLGVLYANDEDANDRLGARLSTPSTPGGKPDFSAASALSFMVFVLLYCPCVATVTAIARETGSWKYSAFSVVYNTLVAWIAAFITFTIASMLL